MKLNYSFNGIEPFWFRGALPFPAMRTERVIVHLASRSSSDFPPFLYMGNLLAYRRSSPQQSAVTLLLTYRFDTVPPRTSPQREGVWYPVPGSPIWGQIRIALPPEAVREIGSVSAGDHDYELALEDLQLINVTKGYGHQTL